MAVWQAARPTGGLVTGRTSFAEALHAKLASRPATSLAFASSVVFACTWQWRHRVRFVSAPGIGGVVSVHDEDEVGLGLGDCVAGDVDEWVVRTLEMYQVA